MKLHYAITLEHYVIHIIGSFSMFSKRIFLLYILRTARTIFSTVFISFVFTMYYSIFEIA